MCGWDSISHTLLPHSWKYTCNYSLRYRAMKEEWIQEKEVWRLPSFYSIIGIGNMFPVFKLSCTTNCWLYYWTLILQAERECQYGYTYITIRIIVQFQKFRYSIRKFSSLQMCRVVVLPLSKNVSMVACSNLRICSTYTHITMRIRKWRIIAMMSCFSHLFH